MFAEHDKNALEVSQMISGTTEIKSFRTTTDQRLQKDLAEPEYS